MSAAILHPPWLRHGLALLATGALNLGLVLGLAHLRTPATELSVPPPLPARRIIAAPPPQAMPPPPPTAQSKAQTSQTGPPAIPALNLPSTVAAPSLGEVDEFAVGPVGVAASLGAPADLALALPAPEALVLDESLVDEPPTIIDAPPPRYPPSARAEGVEGEVLLQVLVDPQGRVSDVRIRRANPPGVFDDEARRAVRRWRLKPATLRGKPVATWVRQRLAFKLQ